MKNYWLKAGKIRRILNYLQRYIGLKYKDTGKALVDEAKQHPDWEADFTILCYLNKDDEIDRIVLEM